MKRICIFIISICGLPSFAQNLQLYTWGNHWGFVDQPITTLTTGENYILAIQKDGKAVAWGETNMIFDTRVQEIKKYLKEVKQIVSKSNTLFILHKNGTISLHSSFQQKTTPEDINKVTEIGGWGNRYFALLENGEIRAWGNDTLGMHFDTFKDVTNILYTADWPTFVTKNGNIINYNGSIGPWTKTVTSVEAQFLEAGYPPNSDYRLLPSILQKKLSKSVVERADTNREFVDVIFNTERFMALTKEGRVKGFSLSGIHVPSFAPEEMTDIKAISPLGYGMAILQNNGKVTVWGLNEDKYNVTTMPLQHRNVKQLAVYKDYFLVLNDEGVVFGYGNNFYGQSRPPENLGKVKAIATGGYRTLAVLENGSVAAWGGITDGGIVPAYIPSNLDSVVDIAVYHNTGLALKSDSTIEFWTSTPNWQMPKGIKGVKQIALAPAHAVALKSDGTCIAWGSDQYGQIGFLSEPNAKKIKYIRAWEGSTGIIYEDSTVRVEGSFKSQFPELKGSIGFSFNNSLGYGWKEDGSYAHAYRLDPFYPDTLLSGVKVIEVGHDYVVSYSNVGSPIVTHLSSTFTPEGFQESFSIFPNPTQGQVTVSFPSSFPSHSTVRILTIQGEVVVTENPVASSTFHILHTERLSNGIYLIEVKSESNVLRKAFLKF